MKKYEFTGETKVIQTLSGDVELHRIRAVTNVGSVKAGDLGGWIEKEENLFYEGEAWVYGDAEVYGDAIVCDGAIVRGNAEVYGGAIVRGNAIVCGNAEVRGNVIVRGNAAVFTALHILIIGPIGSRNDFTTFYRDKDNEITVKCGCFNGKISSFLEKVRETHGDSKHAKAYETAAELARQQIVLSP